MRRYITLINQIIILKRKLGNILDYIILE